MAKKTEKTVQLRCDSVPGLLITTPHVEFVDGLATVTESEAESILDSIGETFGLTATGAETDAGESALADGGDGK